MCRRCGTFGCAPCIFATVKQRSVCVTCAQKGLGRAIGWERRKELGWRKAFTTTVREVMRSPTRFHRTPSTQEGALSAVGFGVLCWTVGLALTYLIAGLLWMIGGAVALTQGGEWEPMGWVFLGSGGTMVVLSPLVALLLGPANALVGLVISAAAAHGTLALFGRTKASFETTLRAICYANAPYVWSFVPVLGSLVFVWVVAQETIAVRETHDCGTDWAAFAVITHRVVLTVLLLGAYLLFFLGLATLPTA